MDQRRAILIALLAAAPLLLAFFRWEGGSLSSYDVDFFFRGRTVDGHYAVALKKRLSRWGNLSSNGSRLPHQSLRV